MSRTLPLEGHSWRAKEDPSGKPRNEARVSASFGGMLFCPRQAEVVQTGDLPIAFAISCQLTSAAAFAVRIAFVTSSRVMAVVIRLVSVALRSLKHKPCSAANFARFLQTSIIVANCSSVTGKIQQKKEAAGVGL